jgi:hypothetical protein
MSWDNITGESRILPGGTGGNEIILESGKPKKVRLILRGDEQPYSYLEHCLEVEKVENGQLVRTFRTIRCPQTTKNPNAKCPLCDGQQVRRRTRHALNAWDYDQGKIQKLNQGDSVFKPIATTRKMGVDITSVDWAIMKTGEGRNDTEYTATNLGQSLFTLPADAHLYDLETEYAPHTIEEMKGIVESAGADWDKLIVPPALTYPSLQEALEHKMPNGKYKDQLFKDIWEADKTNRGMIYYLGMKSDRISPEKAAAQVILASLGGISIPGVPAGSTPPLPSQVHTSMNNVPQGIQMQTPTANHQAQSTTGGGTVSSARQDKINKINGIFSTKEKFVKGGFQVIIDTMKQASNGKTNIVDFTDTELDSLLVTCEQA